MGATKYLLPICLLIGLIINIGLRGVGWIAHMVVPGLMLGVVLFVVVQITLAVRRS